MARSRNLGVLMLLAVAGCSSGQAGHAMPVQSQAESPDKPGRGCVTTIRPDGTPDFGAGCTGSDQLRFEQHFYK